MAIPMKITTNQGIAVRSVPDGAPEAYVDEDGILAYLDDVQGVPFVISGLTPTMSVTGSPEVTYFTRSGTDYTQVLWRQSGGFTLSGDVPATGIALVGGGGSGAGAQEALPEAAAAAVGFLSCHLHLRPHCLLGHTP